EVHTRISGVADHLADNEQQALAITRSIVANLNRPALQRLTLISSCVAKEEPLYSPEEIYGIIPAGRALAYDVREVIARLVDASRFHEFKALYGPTIVCGFARLWGFPLGIVANNGVLFGDSARKATHFIEICCQRHIPLLFLQNITGFMVGKKVEHEGI